MKALSVSLKRYLKKGNKDLTIAFKSGQKTFAGPAAELVNIRSCK
jgi:hypothetical protein